MASLKAIAYDGQFPKVPASADDIQFECPISITGSPSGSFVCTVDNDNANNGHALKVTSDGVGSGTHILEVETGTTTVMRVRGDGRVGIGNPIPNAISHALTVNGDTRTNGLLDVDGNTIRIRISKTPSSSSDTGEQGEICYDSNFIYICIATNTWKRITLESF